MIQALTASLADQAASLYTGCALAGETLFSPLSKEEFSRLFLFCKSAEGLALADVREGRLLGFVCGSMDGRRGFLNALMVQSDHRRQGIARALIEALCDALRARGAETLEISGDGPIKTNWLIPGTNGHDHNNMPGVDEQSLLSALLPRFGFRVLNAQVGMYLSLSSYCPPEDLKDRIATCMKKASKWAFTPPPFSTTLTGSATAYTASCGAACCKTSWPRPRIAPSLPPRCRASLWALPALWTYRRAATAGLPASAPIRATKSAALLPRFFTC